MDEHVKTARFVTDLLENKFSFLGFKFGLDPIIGIIPFVGDVIGFVLSGYIIWIAHQVNIPAKQIAKMWKNVLFDLVIGTIPFIGDVSDFFYKASSKNMRILEEHYSRKVIDGEVVG